MTVSRINQNEGDVPKPALSPAERRHRRVGWYGCILGVVVGLSGLLLGRLGQLWIAFDVFSQFTAQFAFLTAAFCISLALPRAKVLVACMLFVGMVLAYGIWPFWSGPGVAAQASQLGTAVQAIRIASFNTWMPNETPEAVISEIARIDADVVALIEFGRNKVKLLPQLKKQYPYQADCTGNPHCSLAILSKYPLNDVEFKVLWTGPPLIRAVLGGKHAGLNVVAVHTTRFPQVRAQFKQVKALSALIQSLPGPKLVMGDFNATPFSRIAHVITDEADLNRLTDLPSWPAWSGLPQLAIDHIFASKDVSVVEGQELGNPSGSDHFPVILTISLPTPPAGT